MNPRDIERQAHEYARRAEANGQVDVPVQHLRNAHTTIATYRALVETDLRRRYPPEVTAELMAELDRVGGTEQAVATLERLLGRAP
jgi:hypothetical protein